MWYFHALWGRVWAPVAAHAGERAEVELLDAGCGTGGMLKRFAAVRPGWRLQGLDYSADACAYARVRTGVPITQGSVEELPYGDAAFDVIVSLDVVCQVEDDGRALREFARCVRPGGLVVVTAPALPWLWSYHDEACQTRRRYRGGELAARAREAELRVEFESFANLVALPFLAARRKLLPPAKPTSDMRVYPAPLEALLRGLTGTENAWLRGRRRVPLGSSMFLVASKVG